MAHEERSWISAWIYGRLSYDENIHNVSYATVESEQSCDTIWPTFLHGVCRGQIYISLSFAKERFYIFNFLKFNKTFYVKS